jgi:hypothetical protein
MAGLASQGATRGQKLSSPRIVIAVVFAIAITGCGGDTSDSAVPPPTTSTTGAGSDSDDHADEDDAHEATERALTALLLEHGGHLPLDAAVDLFSAAFGAIPGGDEGRFVPDPLDGTAVLLELLRHWDDLSQVQRLAANARLGMPVINSFMGNQGSDGESAVPAEVAEHAQGIIEAFEAALGRTLGLPVEFVLGPMERSTTFAIAAPVRGGSLVHEGTPESCRVIFNQDKLIFSDFVIAHELFHCFQYDMIGDMTQALDHTDRWMIEGQASWAARKVVGDELLILDRHFRSWLDNSTVPLFALRHEGIGFFWVLETLGSDLWGSAAAMLHAGGGEAAITAAGVSPVEAARWAAATALRRSAVGYLLSDAHWDFTPNEVPAFGVHGFTVATPKAPFKASGALDDFAWWQPEVMSIESGVLVDVTVRSGVGALEFGGIADSSRSWVGGTSGVFCLEPMDDGWCACSADGEIQQGSRLLSIAVGSVTLAPFEILVEVIDVDTGFTDGVWEGIITSTPSGIDAGSATGIQEVLTSPFTVTVRDGEIVDGSFVISTFFDFVSPDGFSGAGIQTQPGTLSGCGYRPIMGGDSVVHYSGTITTPEGTGPFEFTTGTGGAEGEHVPPPWRFDPYTDKNHRTGRIDLGEYDGALSEAGFRLAEMIVTFEATLVGG